MSDEPGPFLNGILLGKLPGNKEVSMYAASTGTGGPTVAQQFALIQTWGVLAS